MVMFAKLRDQTIARFEGLQASAVKNFALPTLARNFQRSRAIYGDCAGLVCKSVEQRWRYSCRRRCRVANQSLQRNFDSLLVGFLLHNVQPTRWERCAAVHCAACCSSKSTAC